MQLPVRLMCSALSALAWLLDITLQATTPASRQSQQSLSGSQKYHRTYTTKHSAWAGRTQIRCHEHRACSVPRHTQIHVCIPGMYNIAIMYALPASWIVSRCSYNIIIKGAASTSCRYYYCRVQGAKFLASHSVVLNAGIITSQVVLLLQYSTYSIVTNSIIVQQLMCQQTVAAFLCKFKHVVHKNESVPRRKFVKSVDTYIL